MTTSSRGRAGNGRVKPVSAPATPDKVSLDLDSLDREGAKGPFTLRHDGKVYALTDPQEIDWQDLMAALNNPHLFFKYVLDDESQRAQFLSTPMPVWKMNRVMEDYLEHFGLPSLPNAIGLPS